MGLFSGKTPEEKLKDAEAKVKAAEDAQLAAETKSEVAEKTAKDAVDAKDAAEAKAKTAEKTADDAVEKAKGKPGFDAKAIVKEAAKKGRKIFRNDRLDLVITSDDLTHYKKGQRIQPHVVYGEKLLEDGVAEKYVAPKKKKAEKTED